MICMSQVLAPRQNRNEILLFQDLYFIKKTSAVKTEIKETMCSVCEKGLGDGVSITAKIIRAKTRFFCQYHFPIDF